jgi:hypothetical protein
MRCVPRTLDSDGSHKVRPAREFSTPIAGGAPDCDWN